MKLALCIVLFIVILPNLAASQSPYAVNGWYNSPHAFPVLRVHIVVSGGSVVLDSAVLFSPSFATGYADSTGAYCTNRAYSSFRIVWSPPFALADSCFQTSPVLTYLEEAPEFYGFYSISGCFTSPGVMTAKLTMDAGGSCTESTPELTLHNFEVTAVETPSPAHGPTQFQVFQNYPNPFNPTTSIEYALPRKMHVTIGIYDVLGRPVALLLDREPREEGLNREMWNAAGVGSGVYYCRVQAGEFMETRKLILLE